MDVPSLQEFTDLKYKVSQLESKLDFLEKEILSTNNTTDLIIQLLKPHLSPIQIRKLKKRLN